MGKSGAEISGMWHCCRRCTNTVILHIDWHRCCFLTMKGWFDEKNGRGRKTQTGDEIGLVTEKGSNKRSVWLNLVMVWGLALKYVSSACGG